MTYEKKIIGRKDIADFPELDLFDIAVKIDTGAYTSSIHCHHISEIEMEGKKAICFSLLDPGHPNYNEKQLICTNYRQKRIKSSTGHTQVRYIITTSIVLFNQTYPAELSLSERSSMKYPVLLGRKLLKKRFIVDPAKINLSFKNKQNTKNINIH